MDEDGRLWLEDTGSTNGTFVGNTDSRIRHAALANGQTVYLAERDTAYRVVF